MNMRKIIRQKAALERLEDQLESGKKPERIVGKTTNKLVPLEKTDIERIKKQIEILRVRTGSPKANLLLYGEYAKPKKLRKRIKNVE
jgi:hypothetical protein